jgi:hypothetical protein
MRPYIALLHHPVYNKVGDVITTSITGSDLHDIARAALTYGIAGYYVVNPLPAQREFAERIVGCWRRGESFEFNPTRAEAFEILKVVSSLDEVIEDIKERSGRRPKIVVTSAKAKDGTGYEELGEKIGRSKEPYLVLFGTGWGLTKEVVESADYVLEPIKGKTDYRHLSVRAAVAIILDRLLGREGS